LGLLSSNRVSTFASWAPTVVSGMRFTPRPKIVLLVHCQLINGRYTLY